MEQIKKMLYEGKHSLVIKTKEGKTIAFDGPGVRDLLLLLRESPHFLDEASVADKVVGKAAAALMILGGVKAIFADIISLPAIALFASTASDVDVSYNNKVEYIVNRTQTGWCPMELACKEAKTPEECLEKIKAKLAELSKKQ